MARPLLLEWGAMVWLCSTGLVSSSLPRSVELSGAALSMSQDEQHLWVGSWESVALISLADERLVLGKSSHAPLLWP